MPRPLPARLIALALPALASCSFLLDFDELREGGPRPAQAGAAGSGAGSAGKGGTAGMGGAAGKGGQGGSGGGAEAGEGGNAGEGGEGGASSDCPPECDDGDPCTEDGCTSTGACTHADIAGLVLDGIDARIPAGEHFRVTMTAARDAFFLSSYAKKEGTPDVTLYRLGAEDPTVTPIATLGSLGIAEMGGGEPLSAAGLAVDPGFGLLHAFVALQNRVGTGARVWHVVLDGNLMPQLRTPVGPSYWAGSPYNHPVALSLRGDVYSAWIAEDQTVALGGPGAPMLQTLAQNTPASTVALLGAAGGDPVVLYTTAGGGVYLESPSVAAMPIEECQTLPGEYLSSGATDTTIPGFWLTHWTKVGQATQTDEGYLTTDGRGLGCAASGCTLDEISCSADSGSNLVRNQAILTGVRTGDPNGLVTLVQAMPFLSVEGDEVAANLILLPARVDFGRVPFQAPPEITPLGEPIRVSSRPATAPDFRGPDWPAMAFVPPHHLALSFIEPAQAGDVLRIQRYRVCTTD
jgi:hypothetical protein